MRTNIVLDEDLVKEGFRLTEARTKRELVDLALKELITRRKRKDILKWAGKVDWQGDLDEMRKGRFDPD
ncbi:MAG: type II toxin-antitoxin system VapB family antitoxin [Actinomycetota bacterium]